jgi:hypothetical protein
VLLLTAIYVPGLAELLRVEKPGGDGWGLILGLSLAPWLVGQIIKEVTGMRMSR